MSAAAAWSWPGLYPDPAGAEPLGAMAEPCGECGLPHTIERRLAILRRVLPATVGEITEAYPHIWPPRVVRRSHDGYEYDSKDTAKMLFLDLRKLGAVRSWRPSAWFGVGFSGAVWSLP